MANALMMPDIAGAFAQGQAARALRQEGDRQNALREFLAANGAGLMAGDQNALAGFAQYDPMGALGIQSRRQEMDQSRQRFDLQQQQTRQSMSIDAERLKIAQAQGERAATEFGWQVDDRKRGELAAKAKSDAEQAQIAWSAGPEEFDRWNDGHPEYANISFEDAPYKIAEALGAAAVLDAMKGPEPMSPEGKLAHDVRAGLASEPAPTELITGDAARALGLDPSKAYNRDPDGKITQIGGGGVTVNNTGPIPQGYQNVYDEAGRIIRQEPIPGGPAATEAAALSAKMDKAADQRNIAGETIVDAAEKAREIIGRSTTGIVGAGLAKLPSTEAAELRRQVEVLKSAASIETLSQMRATSPTGGALGNVTEGEHRLLSSKAGAIDANASKADFERALDDYERTLLRIIHGSEAGDRIFDETRGGEESLDDILGRYTD